MDGGLIRNWQINQGRSQLSIKVRYRMVTRLIQLMNNVTKIRSYSRLSTARNYRQIPVLVELHCGGRVPPGLPFPPAIPIDLLFASRPILIADR